MGPNFGSERTVELFLWPVSADEITVQKAKCLEIVNGKDGKNSAFCDTRRLSLFGQDCLLLSSFRLFFIYIFSSMYLA